MFPFGSLLKGSHRTHSQFEKSHAFLRIKIYQLASILSPTGANKIAKAFADLMVFMMRRNDVGTSLPRVLISLSKRNALAFGKMCQTLPKRCKIFPKLSETFRTTLP